MTGYISRDKKGELWIHQECPVRGSSIWLKKTGDAFKAINLLNVENVSQEISMETLSKAALLTWKDEPIVIN